MKKPDLKNIETELISKIVSLFETTDKDRSTTLGINQEVQNQLTYSDKDDLKGKLPDNLEICESYKANVNNSLFKSAEGLFSVASKDLEKAEEALIKKGSLVESLEEGGILEEQKAAAENWIEKGEFILYHYYGKNTEFTMAESTEIDEFGNETYVYEKDEVVTYEGAMAEAVDPSDFVFDVTKTGNRFSLKKFQSPECFKIRRSWSTLDEIEANEAYSEYLTKDKIDELRKLTEGAEPNTQQDFAQKDKTSSNFIDGDQFQLLHYYGNIRTKEGKLLKDYIITVIADKYIIQFEENPGICPFVYYPFYTDYKTRRGLSALVPAVSLNDKASKIFDATLKALSFANNPAYWVRKGTNIEKKEGELQPGEKIEWDDKSGSNTPPIPIDSFKQIPLNFEGMTFIEKKLEQVTGITKYAAGDASGIARTATETSAIITGANTRQSDKILDLSLHGVIPSIKIISNINAYYKPDEMVNEIKPINYQNEQGKVQQGVLTKDIERGNYSFNIGNSQSIIEQKAKLKEVMPVIQGLEAMGLKFKPVELWNYAAQAYEIAKPSQYIEDDLLSEVLSQLPPDQQEQVKQMLAQQVMSMLGGMNGQGQAMPQNIPVGNPMVQPQ